MWFGHQFQGQKVKGQLVADVLDSQHAGTGATWRKTTKILSTCRGGGILCRHAHSLLICELAFAYTYVLPVVICLHIRLLCPAPNRRGIKRWCCLTSVWRLSSDVCLTTVAYVGPKSRTERPRKTKIGTKVAHVTGNSDTTFKVKRSLGRFTHRRIGASGSCSDGRGSVLAVGNCCYVSVCSAARDASAPTGRSFGAYRGGRPPTACYVQNKGYLLTFLYIIAFCEKLFFFFIIIVVVVVVVICFFVTTTKVIRPQPTYKHKINKRLSVEYSHNRVVLHSNASFCNVTLSFAQVVSWAMSVVWDHK